MKLITSNNEAIESLLEGARIVSDAVGSTLGPLGSNVAIEKEWSSPQVVHDGVTVAKEIEDSDSRINLGITLIKEASSKTNDLAGDGTTTSAVLAYNLINEGFSKIKGGVNQMKLKKGMELSLESLLVELKNKSKKITTEKEIEQIAIVSSQREDLGKLVSGAVSEVGKNGMVVVESGSGTETTVNLKKGIEIDRGFVSPYLTNNKNKTEVSLKDTYILLTTEVISSTREIAPLLERIMDKSKNLLIVADDVVGEALSQLIILKLNGTFNLDII